MNAPASPPALPLLRGDDRRQANRPAKRGEAHTAQTPDGLTVAIRTLDPGAPWVEAWRQLGRNALVPNLFFQPGFAFAAAPVFGEGVKVLIVADRPPETPGAKLLALWPFKVRRNRWGLPLGVAMGWTHRFGALGVPLVDGQAPETALRALLSAPRYLPGLPRRFLFTYAATTGRFADVLAGVLGEGGLREARSWQHERAFLDPPAGANYLEDTVSPRKLSKLRQQFRRLEAKGEVAFESLRSPQDLHAAVEDYIALETRGWKGRAGTAVGCSPAERDFLHAAVAGTAKDNAVRVHRLTLDGRTIAASIAFVTGDQVWYLKISFDEDHAKESPGSQLVQRSTEEFLADPAISRGDSCAPPNYRLMETFWGQRLGLSNRLIEAWGGDALFPLAARLERARERAVAAVLAWRKRRAEGKTDDRTGA